MRSVVGRVLLRARAHLQLPCHKTLSLKTTVEGHHQGGASTALGSPELSLGWVLEVSRT